MSRVKRFPRVKQTIFFKQSLTFSSSNTSSEGIGTEAQIMRNHEKRSWRKARLSEREEDGTFFLLLITSYDEKREKTGEKERRNE